MRALRHSRFFVPTIRARKRSVPSVPSVLRPVNGLQKATLPGGPSVPSGASLRSAHPDQRGNPRNNRVLEADAGDGRGAPSALSPVRRRRSANPKGLSLTANPSASGNRQPTPGRPRWPPPGARAGYAMRPWVAMVSLRSPHRRPTPPIFFGVVQHVARGAGLSPD